MKEQMNDSKLVELANLILSLRQNQTNASDEKAEPEMIGQNIGEILNEADVCKLLGVGPSTVFKLRNNGQLKFRRVGVKKVVFLRQDLLDYLETRQR